MVLDLYKKDNGHLGMDLTKNANYMTKTNRIQHLNSVYVKCIFLKRPDEGKKPMWTLLLTFSCIAESWSFYYVRMDLFAVCLYHMIAHKESNKQFGLTYCITLPYFLRLTVELFCLPKQSMMRQWVNFYFRSMIILDADVTARSLWNPLMKYLI